MGARYYNEDSILVAPCYPRQLPLFLPLFPGKPHWSSACISGVSLILRISAAFQYNTCAAFSAFPAFLEVN
jgi:hypothetical protein